MEKNTQRLVCFDILRITAAFAVVVLHLSAQHWADIDVSSRAWFAFNLYDSAVRWAVPVFVMISGALFLGRDISLSVLLKKNIARIAAAFFFWSALYALRGYFVYHDEPRKAIIAFFEGHYHMWFLYMIVGLYLLIPLLRRIVCDEKLTKYFITLALLFGYLLPQAALLFSFVSPDTEKIIQTILQLSYVKFPLGFTVYFVGGYYLSQHKIARSTEITLYVLGILGFLFTAFASWKLSITQGTAAEVFYSYSTFNVLMMAAAVFVFAVQHLNLPKLKETALRALSKYSFGAYLVHAMVIEILNDRFGLNTLSMNAFFSVPLLAILVFTLSMAISVLLNQIPFVKKYLV